MLHFDSEYATPGSLNSSRRESTHVSLSPDDTSAPQFYALNNPSQETWHRQLALANPQLGLEPNSYFESVGNGIDDGTGVFDMLAYSDTPFLQEDGNFNDHKAMKQARRKAQNRAAQRKFRERKDCQLKQLEAEITELRAQVAGSRSKITGLQDALTEARTQVETLKSILPSIARQSRLPGSDGDDGMVSFLRRDAARESRSVSISTPMSLSSEDGLSFLS